jgi:hypothetical protein
MRNIPRKKLVLYAIPVLLLLALLTYALPPVQARVDNWLAELQYTLNPPEEAVFLPQGQQEFVNFSVSATLEALTPTITPTPAPTSTTTPTVVGPTLTPLPTATPTITPTPLPGSAQINGVRFISQRGLWNYCGPATLAMAVTYWGWEADRLDTGAYLRGSLDRKDDKNVMPYEMQNYVNDYTGLRMVVREGGTLELLKTFLAEGFPIMIEKDDVLPDVGWLGHYLLLTGYDDASQTFTSMDAYHGAGTEYTYDEIESAWRAFNFTFLLTYPPEREQSVNRLLGPYLNADYGVNLALARAQLETQTLSGRPQLYAWFNLGTSYVRRLEYTDAAFAFDRYFASYAALPESERPWRMVWYQTTPYWAYYYTGRYQDVVTLATTTLDAMREPILEESFYWRALGKEALGDTAGAITDLETTVTLNANFAPGWQQLQRIRGQ